MFDDSNPYEGQKNGHISVIRVKPGHSVHGILVGTPTKSWIHYYNGKSLPCIRPQSASCPLCDEEIARRYYSWYPIRGRSGALALLELTASAEEELLSQARDIEKGELICINAFRTDTRKNSPVRVKVEAEIVEPDAYESWWKNAPTEQVTQRILMSLWGIPHPGQEESTEAWLERVAKNLRHRM